MGQCSVYIPPQLIQNLNACFSISAILLVSRTMFDNVNHYVVIYWIPWHIIFLSSTGVFGRKSRRKEKDSSPVSVHGECRPYLDDDYVQEKIQSTDMAPLVKLPYGLNYNEWLATHSKSLYGKPQKTCSALETCVCIFVSMDGQFWELCSGNVASGVVNPFRMWSRELRAVFFIKCIWKQSNCLYL